MSSRREPSAAPEEGEAAPVSPESTSLESERQELAGLVGQLLAWYWLNHGVSGPGRVDDSGEVNTIEVAATRIDD